MIHYVKVVREDRVDFFLMIANVSAVDLVWDFEEDQAAIEPRWTSVNDGVMGGLSKGGVIIRDGEMHFSGVLSLENNGGFSSVRTRGYESDLSAADGLKLRVKGDGRTYQLRLQTDARFRGRSRISYRAEFDTVRDKWIEVEVPFKTMRPGWRGMELKGPKLNLKKISEVGLLLGDKKAGKFSLHVDWIKSYKDD